MPTYEIAAPDGKTYRIDGPEGASTDQVRAEVIRQNPFLGAPTAPEPESSGRSFGQGMGAGVDMLQGALYTVPEVLGELTGHEGLEAFGERGRVAQAEQRAARGETQLLSEVEDAGDFGQWAKDIISEQSILWAPTLAGAAAGAVGGPVTATIGAIIGAGFPAALGLYEAQGALKDIDPEAEAPGWVIGAGTAIGMLDRFTPNKLGSQLARRFAPEAAKKIAERAVARGLVKRVSVGAGQNAVAEGLTEAVQGEIANFAAAQGTGTEYEVDPLQMFEEGAAGALMGGVAGAVSGVPRDRVAVEEDPTKKAREEELARERIMDQAAQRGDVRAFDQPELFATDLERAQLDEGRVGPPVLAAETRAAQEEEEAAKPAPPAPAIGNLLEEAEIMEQLEAEEALQREQSEALGTARAESELESLTAEQERLRQTQSAQLRGGILDSVIEQDPSAQYTTLSNRFKRALTAAGIARTALTEAEIRKIHSAKDVVAALRPEIIEEGPDEGGSWGIPELGGTSDGRRGIPNTTPSVPVAPTVARGDESGVPAPVGTDTAQEPTGVPARTSPGRVDERSEPAEGTTAGAEVQQRALTAPQEVKTAIYAGARNLWDTIPRRQRRGFNVAVSELLGEKVDPKYKAPSKDPSRKRGYDAGYARGIEYVQEKLNAAPKTPERTFTTGPAAIAQEQEADPYRANHLDALDMLFVRDQKKKLAAAAEQVAPITEQVAPITEQVAPITEQVAPITEQVAQETPAARRERMAKTLSAQRSAASVAAAPAIPPDTLGLEPPPADQSSEAERAQRVQEAQAEEDAEVTEHIERGELLRAANLLLNSVEESRGKELSPTLRNNAAAALIKRLAADPKYRGMREQTREFKTPARVAPADRTPERLRKRLQPFAGPTREELALPAKAEITEQDLKAFRGLAQDIVAEREAKGAPTAIRRGAAETVKRQKKTNAKYVSDAINRKFPKVSSFNEAIKKAERRGLKDVIAATDVAFRNFEISQQEATNIKEAAATTTAVELAQRLEQTRNRSRGQEELAARGLQFSTREGSFAGIDVESVRAHIEKITAHWRGGVTVEVVQSINDLPDVFHDTIKPKVLETTDAFQVRGTNLIYVVANHFNALEEVTGTLYHEALGHLGLEQAFGKALDTVLAGIYKVPKFKFMADSWAAANPDVYKGRSNPHLRALEEVLAIQSENGVVEASVLDKITYVIKQYARRVGFSLEYSPREVSAILARAHATVLNPQVTTNSFKKWFGNSVVVDQHNMPMRMYHATGEKADYESFDTLKGELGTHVGTAAQALDVSEDALEKAPFVFTRKGVGAGVRTIPVFVKLENPLRLEDRENFNVYTVLDQLYEKRIVPVEPLLALRKKANAALRRDWRKPFTAKESRQVVEAIQQMIKDAGYDGIVYINRHEGLAPKDPNPAAAHPDYKSKWKLSDEDYLNKFGYRHPEDSYIVFDPTQLKSAIGNKGTFNPKDPRIQHSTSQSSRRQAAADAKALRERAEFERDYARSDDATKLRTLDKLAQSRSWPERKQVLRSFAPAASGNSVGALAYALPTDDVVRWAKEEGMKTKTGADKVAPGFIRAESAMRSMSELNMKTSATLARIGKRWSDFINESREKADILHKLIIRSTLHQIDARELHKNSSLAKTPLQKDSLRDYREIGPKGQQLYGVALNSFRSQHNNMLEAALNSVANWDGPEDIKDVALEALIRLQATGDKLKVYFPLMRFGQFWVRFGEAKDVTRQFYMFESAAARNLAVEEFRQKNPTETAIEQGNDPKELHNLLKRGASGVFKELFDKLDAGGPNVSAEMREMLTQLYVESLPLNDIRARSSAKREGITGYSTDVPRVFFQAQHTMGRQYARYVHGEEIRTAASTLKGEVNNSVADKVLEAERNGATADELEQVRRGALNRQERLRALTNEYIARLDRELTPTEDENSWLDWLARKSNQFVFYYMLTSARNAAVQTTQVFVFSAPTLAAEYGDGVRSIPKMLGLLAKNAVSKAYDIRNIRKVKDAGLKKALMDASIWAERHKIFDITYTSDFLSEATDPTIPTAKLQTAKKTGKAALGAMRYLFQTAEQASRWTTYLTTIELAYAKAKKEGLSNNAAAARAKDEAMGSTETGPGIVKESMFNYEGFNKPRLFTSNPIARVATQFATFPLQANLFLLRNLGIQLRRKGMTKEHRKAAATKVLGTLAMAGMFSGLTGLPGYTLITGLIDAFTEDFGEEGDDPENPLAQRDADLWLREVFFPQYFGPTSSIGAALGLDDDQVDLLDLAVTRGPISAATGWNIGPSVSLDSMWFQTGPPTDSNRAWFESTVFRTISGPTGGMLGQVFGAFDEIANGHPIRAMEKTLPNFFRGTATAARLKTEGMATRQGDVVRNPDWYGIGKLAGQVLGFGNTDVGDIQDTTYRIASIEAELSKEKEKLYRRYDQALRSGNDARVDRVMDEIIEFNEKNWFMPITPPQLRTSVFGRARGRAESQVGLTTSRAIQPWANKLLARHKQ